MRSMRSALAALCLLLALAPAAVGDEVVLRTGDVLRGTLREEEGHYVLEHPVLGEITLARADVVDVVRDRPVLREGDPLPPPLVRGTPSLSVSHLDATSTGAVVVRPDGTPANIPPPPNWSPGTAPSEPCPPEPCTPAACDPCAPEPAGPWSFAAGLSLSDSSGNTDNLNLLLEGELNYKKEPWTALARLAYIYGATDGERSAENWHGKLRGERKLGSRSYAFLQGLYDRDEPADLEYRVTTVAGLGWTLVDQPDTKLRAEAGGGFVWEKYISLAETGDPSAYLGLDFERKFGQGGTFEVEYEFLPNLGDFGLSVQHLHIRYGVPLCAEIAITLGVRLDYVFEPPSPGIESLDTFLAAGLRLTL